MRVHGSIFSGEEKYTALGSRVAQGYVQSGTQPEVESFFDWKLNLSLKPALSFIFQGTSERYGSQDLLGYLWETDRV